MTDIKKRQEKVTPERERLSRYLYIITICGLVLAMALMVAGFLINIFGDFEISGIKDFAINTIGPEKLEKALNEPSASKLFLFEYAGIFFLILVPIAGIVCAIGFFAHIKKYNLMLIAIAVLLILAASAVIAFMR